MDCRTPTVTRSPHRLAHRLTQAAIVACLCLSAGWAGESFAAKDAKPAQVSKAEREKLISELESIGLSTAAAERLADRIIAGDPEAQATGRLLVKSAGRMQWIGAEEFQMRPVLEEIIRRRLTDDSNGGAADALVGAVEVQNLVDPAIAKLPANASSRAGDVARALIKARTQLQLVGEDGSAIGNQLLASITRQAAGGMQADRLIRETIQPLVDQQVGRTAVERAAAKPGSAGIGTGVSSGQESSGRPHASDRYPGPGSGPRQTGPGNGNGNGSGNGGGNGAGKGPAGGPDDTAGGGGGGSGSDGGSDSASNDSGSGDGSSDSSGSGDSNTDTAADDEPIEHLGLDGEFTLNGDHHPTEGPEGTPRAPGMEKERGSGTELSNATGGRLGRTEAANARRGVDLKTGGGGAAGPKTGDTASGVLMTPEEHANARRALGMAAGGGVTDPARDDIQGHVVTDRDLKELGLKGTGGAKGPTDSSGRTPPTQAPQSPLAGAGPIVPPSGLKNSATVSNLGAAPALKAEVKAGLGK